MAIMQKLLDDGIVNNIDNNSNDVKTKDYYGSQNFDLGVQKINHYQPYQSGPKG